MHLRTHAPGWHHRGYLPHIDSPSAWQTVTFRLWDSLPRPVLAQLDASLMQLPEEERSERRLRRIHDLLDNGLGSCLLRDHADLVRDVLIEGHGRQYQLSAWVVMPNHVHLLVGPPAHGDRVPLAALMQRWKGASAHAINQRRGTRGRLWHPDYFDRMIRDQAHFHRALAYILDNPVKAGFTTNRGQWEWCGSPDGLTSACNSPGARISVRLTRRMAD